MNKLQKLIFAICVSLLLITFPGKSEPESIIEDWKMQYNRLQQQLLDIQANGLAKKVHVEIQSVHNPHCLIWSSDRSALDIIIRRTEALIADLKLKGARGDLDYILSRINQIKGESSSRLGKVSSVHEQTLFLELAALRRQAAFSNPQLDFDDILVVVRREQADHMCEDPMGVHQGKGGSIFIIKNAFSDNKQIVDVLQNSTVEQGRLQGLRLSGGSFMSPDLSYDGQEIVFAYTDKGEHENLWHEDTLVVPDHRDWKPELVNHTWKWHLHHPKNAFHIYKVKIDGSGLKELTYGPWDDFDPCYLPNDRIVFVSSRRGGFGRCHQAMYPTFTLYSMKPDGSDITCLSYHETNEWQPSVDNEGMIVYTRWDYVDRGSDHAHHMWRCFPDGRDSRSPHGNYPHWYFNCDVQGYQQPQIDVPRWGTIRDGRRFRPWFEGNYRAIPDVPGKYIAVAASHHGPTDLGSVILINIQTPDDGMMSQVTRVTPEALFPEAEDKDGKEGTVPYGTPYPISEDYYLVNHWSDLYLLDKFGNRELICNISRVPGSFEGSRDGKWKGFRILDPIPLKPRDLPPVLATQTYQGERYGSADHKRAVISIQNVYEADPDVVWPDDRQIKWMRMIQIFPKSTYSVGEPEVGNYQGICRMSLGVVPVEEDGSVYCEAPVGKPIYFQVLDENMMAIQSMRSATYVHPGERLACVGCHEYKWKSIPLAQSTVAMNRDPSPLQPEYGVVEPLSFYRTVKPVFEQTCKPCHQQNGSPLTDFSWNVIGDDDVYRWPQGAGGNTSGSSRSFPNCLGAYKSKIGQKLLNDRHRAARADGTISDEDYNRVITWLDAASYQLGAYIEIDKQEAGELVWPLLDVDPDNPNGVEYDRPLPNSSSVVSVKENSDNNKFPAIISFIKGQLRVKQAKVGPAAFSIFSLNGKLLHSQSWQDNGSDFIINLDHIGLSQSMMIIKVKFRNGDIKTKQLMLIE